MADLLIAAVAPAAAAAKAVPATHAEDTSAGVPFVLNLLNPALPVLNLGATAAAPAVAKTADAATPADESLASLSELLLALMGAPAAPAQAAATPAATSASAPTTASTISAATSPATSADPAAAATTAARALVATVTAEISAPSKTAESLPDAASSALAHEGAQLAGTMALIQDTPAAGFERFEAWLQNPPLIVPMRDAPAAAASTHQISLATDHPDWADSLGQQVLWSAGRGVQSAEIRLHPADLGSIHVSLHVEQGQASVSFNAAHPLARDALEQALPRLREMFAQEGLNLSQTQVSSQASQDGGRRAPTPQSAVATPNQAGDDNPVPVTEPARVMQRVGLLDDYA